MKLSDQLTTLEQGIKLKELGIAQASLYYHTVCPDRIVTSEYYNDNIKTPIAKTAYCSAFTCAELGAMLPDVLPVSDFNPYLVIKKDKDLWCVTYDYESHTGATACYHRMMSHANPAIAMADMLIFLIENKLTTSAECNARLMA